MQAAAAAAFDLCLVTNSLSKMSNNLDPKSKNLMRGVLTFLHLNFVSWTVVGVSSKPDLQFAV